MRQKGGAKYSVTELYYSIAQQTGRIFQLETVVGFQGVKAKMMVGKETSR